MLGGGVSLSSTYTRRWKSISFSADREPRWWRCTSPLGGFLSTVYGLASSHNRYALSYFLFVSSEGLMLLLWAPLGYFDRCCSSWTGSVSLWQRAALPSSTRHGVLEAVGIGLHQRLHLCAAISLAGLLFCCGRTWLNFQSRCLIVCSTVLLGGVATDSSWLLQLFC